MDLNFIPEITKMLNDFFVSSVVALVSTFRKNVEFVFGWVPELFSLSADVENSFKQFVNLPFTSGAIDFLNWLFGGLNILGFVFLTAFSVFMFQTIWALIMFVISKLPIGVKK